MSYNITLNEEAEVIIARRAKRRGITVAEYVTQLANSVTRHQRKRTHSGTPVRSAAEVRELLSAFGRQTGDAYIPDDVDIRELAYDGRGE